MHPYAALSPGIPHRATILHLRSYECLEGNLFNLRGAVPEVSSKKPKGLIGLCCDCVSVDAPVKTAINLHTVVGIFEQLLTLGAHPS